MKWPEAGRRPSKRGRGRDKLNEPKEKKTGQSLLSYTLSRGPRPLDKGVAEKKRKKKGEKEGEERERGRRGWREDWWKKKGDEAGWNKVLCQAVYGVRCLERLRPEFPYPPSPPSDSVVELYHPWLTPSTSSMLLVVDCSRCNYNFDRPLLSRI